MMIKLRDYNIDYLYDKKLKKEGRIELINPKDIGDNNKLSIVSDTMFKTMFFNEDRIKYSSKLLSYFVDVSYEELCKSLKLSKDLLDKDNYYEKGQRVDYVGRIKDTYLNIEVNNSTDPDVMRRNVLYAFRLMNKNNKIGISNRDVGKTQAIQININNFAFVGIDKTIDVYTIQNKDNIGLINSPIIIQIYLPNLIEKLYNEGVEKLSEIERLLLVYVISDIDTCRKVSIGDVIMEEFIKDAKDASRENDTLTSYDKEWETKLWGREEGIEETKINIVKNMLKKGMEISLISEITELPEEEIKDIQNKKD